MGQRKEVKLLGLEAKKNLNHRKTQEAKLGMERNRNGVEELRYDNDHLGVHKGADSFAGHVQRKNEVRGQ